MLLEGGSTYLDLVRGIIMFLGYYFMYIFYLSEWIKKYNVSDIAKKRLRLFFTLIPIIAILLVFSYFIAPSVKTYVIIITLIVVVFILAIFLLTRGCELLQEEKKNIVKELMKGKAPEEISKEFNLSLKKMEKFGGIVKMKEETRKLIEEAKRELKEELDKEKKTGYAESFGVVNVLPNLEKICDLLKERAFELERIRILSRSWHSTVRELQNLIPKLRDTSIFVLILDPNSQYVEERVKENPYDTIEKVKGEIDYSMRKLTEMKKKYSMNRLFVRAYDMLPIFRLTILDDSAFLSYYPKSAPGTTVPVFEIRKGENTFFQALDRYFEYVWRISTEVC